MHADLSRRCCAWPMLGCAPRGAIRIPTRRPNFFRCAAHHSGDSARGCHREIGARRLLLSRVEVSELSAPFTIERGRVKAPEVTGHFMGGNFVLHFDADANQIPARTRIEMTLTGCS